MSPRIVLQSFAKPLLVAGVVWGSSAIGDALAAPGQTPPPCSPDGVCVPRPETFGFYATRWRRFPGDRFGVAPTPADATGPEAEQEEDDRALGGPQLPDSAEEGRVGPSKPAPSNGQRGAPAPVPPAEAGPGAAPAAAPAGGPALEASPPAALPGSEEAPGAQPLPDLGAPPPFGEPPAGGATDPFSAAPPVLPSRSTPQVIAAPLRPAAETAEPTRPPTSNFPSRHNDDAPPALPASLQRVSQVMPGHGTVAAAPISLPPLKQPSSVMPSAPQGAAQPRVAQVNYQAPAKVQLVNPAAAMTGQPGESQLEQAIYYEASDQNEEVLRY